jgi:hypothetical protein
MAWDKTNGMYYRYHREGKKVTREYFGKGEEARLAAGLDERKRRLAQQELTAVKAIRLRWGKADMSMGRWRADTDLLSRAVRLVARARRRRSGDPNVDATSDDVMKELRELIELGESGDKGVLPRVRHLLDRHQEIADHFGDAGNVATELWLKLYAGHNLVMAESTRRKMVLLKASIAGPVPSPLETLMVEQVIIAWLQVNATEALHAQAHQEQASDVVLRERQRQTEASRRLYAVSIKQLAELRKLLPKLADPLSFRLRAATDAPDDPFDDMPEPD